jgi:drug/metabolite transporter (DMT)-like permease
VVYFVGIAAALALGLGYVVQQRVASTMPLSEVLSWRLVLDLMHRRLWWAGIGCMVVGQVLAGLALEMAAVAVVEPLLSANLLFALAFSAALARKRIQWQEVVGALLLSVSLGLFIGVGNPHDSPSPNTSAITVGVAIAAVVGGVVILVAIARRRGLVGESVLLATGAGLLYGLQDTATRAAFVRIEDHGFATLPVNPWLYVVVASAAVGILLSQSAFKTARLDYSLPPIAAAEPIVGIVLGISLLGDVVSVSVLGLLAESICLVGVLAGVILIGRSPNLASNCIAEPAGAPPPARQTDAA